MSSYQETSSDLKNYKRGTCNKNAIDSQELIINLIMNIDKRDVP